METPARPRPLMQRPPAKPPLEPVFHPPVDHQVVAELYLKFVAQVFDIAQLPLRNSVCSPFHASVIWHRLNALPGLSLHFCDNHHRHFPIL
jgi:hypothetical protein